MRKFGKLSAFNLVDLSICYNFEKNLKALGIE